MHYFFNDLRLMDFHTPVLYGNDKIALSMNVYFIRAALFHIIVVETMAVHFLLMIRLANWPQWRSE